MDRVALYEMVNRHAKNSNTTVMTACLDGKSVSIDVTPPLGPTILEKIKNRMVSAIHGSDLVSEKIAITESANPTDPFTRSIVEFIHGNPQLSACVWLIIEVGLNSITNMVTSSHFPVTPDFKLSLCTDIMEMLIIEKAEKGDTQFFEFEAYLRENLNAFLCIDKSSVFVPPPSQTFNIYSDA